MTLVRRRLSPFNRSRRFVVRIRRWWAVGKAQIDHALLEVPFEALHRERFRTAT
jgi:hypothetical protein